MPPKLTPQVPGQPVTDTVDQLENDLAGEGAVGPEETVVVSKADLAALMHRVAALESKPAVATRAVQETNLPEQDKVNPDNIKTPVLTKQGWVVPTTFGANPAQKAL